MTCNCLITQATFQGKEFQHLSNMLPCSHLIEFSVPEFLLKRIRGNRGEELLKVRLPACWYPLLCLTKRSHHSLQNTHNALAKGPDQMRTQHGVHPVRVWRRKITQTLFISITLMGYDAEDDANNPHLERERDMGTFLNNAHQCLRRRASAQCVGREELSIPQWR